MELIKKLRQEQGLSIKQLAESVGRTPGFIAEIERGTRTASEETLDLIAQKLGHRQEISRTADKIDPDLEKIVKEKHANNFLLIVSQLSKQERRAFFKKAQSVVEKKIKKKLINKMQKTN